MQRSGMATISALDNDYHDHHLASALQVSRLTEGAGAWLQTGALPLLLSHASMSGLAKHMLQLGVR